MEKPILSFGQKAVGITFNPSNENAVDRLKQICANAIDELHSVRLNSESNEVRRMCSNAITDIQSGQMWGVKAITWKD